MLTAGDSSHTYTYDANGNALTRNGYGITWSKYNYPTVINGPSESATFSYDAFNKRYKQVYVNGATTETTVYIDRFVEKVSSGGIDDYRNYIYAGNKLVMIVSRKSDATGSIHYLLEDHQNSVDKITDTAGAISVGEDFTAYGARRNPTTWSGSPISADLTTINTISLLVCV